MAQGISQNPDDRGSQYSKPIGPPAPEELRSLLYRAGADEFIGVNLPKIPAQAKSEESQAIVEQLDPQCPEKQRVIKPGENVVTIRTRGVHTIIEPRVELSSEEFKATKSPLSVAIDGYVKGAPWRDPYRAMANLNHHEDVDRIATSATCMQAYDLLKLGFAARFRKGEKFFVRIYTNDCDEDVCMTHYVFHNHGIALKNRGADKDLLEDLLLQEDRLDRTGGGYTSSPKLAQTQKVAWVFQPYRQARVDGKINHLTTALEMSNVILAVSERIDAFVHGKADRIELDTTFHRLLRGEGYEMIKERGSYARTGIFAKDPLKAVITVDFVADGSFKYAVAKLPMSTFPIEAFFEELNIAEGLTTGENNAWGPVVHSPHGYSVLNGGSPRQTGSKLDPATVKEIADKVIAKERERFGF